MGLRSPSLSLSPPFVNKNAGTDRFISFWLIIFRARVDLPWKRLFHQLMPANSLKGLCRWHGLSHLVIGGTYNIVVAPHWMRQQESLQPKDWTTVLAQAEYILNNNNSNNWHKWRKSHYYADWCVPGTKRVIVWLTKKSFSRARNTRTSNNNPLCNPLCRPISSCTPHNYSNGLPRALPLLLLVLLLLLLDWPPLAMREVAAFEWFMCAAKFVNLQRVIGAA